MLLLFHKCRRCISSQPVRIVPASKCWPTSKVEWWIFVLSVRRFEPFNIKPLRLFSTCVPCLWSMASSQDSEWSPDWTTSGIWMLNNCPLNRGNSWIIHTAVRVSHLLWPLAGDAFALRPVRRAEGQGRNSWRHQHQAVSPAWQNNGKEAEMEANNVVRVGRRCSKIDSYDNFG